MNRRDWLKLLLAAPLAAVDLEKLLWLPKPIITVPAMPYGLFNPKADLANLYATSRMSIQFIKQWDVRTDQFTTRFGVYIDKRQFVDSANCLTHTKAV